MSGGPYVINKIKLEALAPTGRAELEEIYTSSFPAEERADFDQLDRHSDALWVVSEPGVRIVGFATVVSLPQSRTILLQYLAVRMENRGRGVGTMILDTLAIGLAQAKDSRGVVLEVEDPDSSANPAVATRRIAFYQRWGARKLQCLSDYFMPSFANPGERVAMTLMWRPIATEIEPAGDSLRALLAELCQVEYSLDVASEHVMDLVSGVRC
jgi:N-acetylglutamate synthase-like GNAT family acetyltransferase